MLKQKLKQLLNKVKEYLKGKNPWLALLAYGIAWMITNGWSYVFIGLGAVLKIGWMWKVGTAYLAFLWLPCTPEKLITIPIALGLYNIFDRKKKVHKGDK